MDLMLNSINRSRATDQRNGSHDQYDTPSKSAHGSALYETIDGYQRQTPAHKATVLSWQQQEYLGKLQQRNFESEKSGDVMEADIPYQEMHSASEQGVACGYNPNHVMMYQGCQKPSNCQKSYAFQVESRAAAAGNTSSLSHSDSDTDFHHLQSFSDHLSTTAVVNENVGTAEEDQSEYTFMSQAGTLAGQQSKLTLCTN